MTIDQLSKKLWPLFLAYPVVIGCGCNSEDSADAGISANPAELAEQNKLETAATPVAVASKLKETTATDSSNMTSTQPASAGAPTNRDGRESKTLNLNAIAMVIPAGWVSQPISGGGPMSPKAVLNIPNKNGKPGVVRITYFPGMKGKNEQNIQRWLGQARKPDGSPISQTDATITSTDLGPVKLTTVDVTGTIKATMRAAAEPNQRLVATIVDHPKGPHFVVAVGEVDLINGSISSIRTFLESTRVIE